MGLSGRVCRHLYGLNWTYIGAIERGERNIALVNIEKIAKALKISLPELFHGF